MNSAREIGKRLQNARKSKNLTQQELADKADIKRSSLANYERGTYNIPKEELISVCKVLDIGVNEILIVGESNIMEQSEQYGKPSYEELMKERNQLQKERDELADQLEERNDELLTVYREKAELERELKKKSS
jgi:transcriptional regulator with XRE-family HTH domain